MFQLTVCIILTVFIIDITLSVLNYKNRTQTIPENVRDVYAKNDYDKWLNYTMEIFKLSIMGKIFSTTLLLAFFLLGIFPKLAQIAENITSHSILKTLVFLGLYGLIDYILGIGFSLYRTFSIEERYGFNRSTKKTFILDQVKGIFLTVLLGGGLMYPLLSLYQQLGNSALLYAWGLIVAVTLVINLLYTRVFIKLFNKLTDLEEGELFDGVQGLAHKTGYEIKKIQIMDASKRSARLNAFFSGFGKFKHIILYDTLIEKCDTDEILSVLSHEIGHAKHKDVLRNFFISILQMGIYLGLLTYFLSNGKLSTAFGFESIHIGFTIILFGILMEPVGLIANIPLTAMSRKAEYAADGFAAESGYKDAMIRALKILARENFSNLTPHPLVVKFTYSHPTISQRIESLNKYS